MPATVATERLIAEVLAALRANIARPFGDHRPPDDTSERYGVVWFISGGTVTASSLAGWHDSAEVIIQVDSSGRTPGQAQWMADKVRALLLGMAGDGYVVELPGAVARDSEGLPGVDAEAHDLFTSRERFRLTVVPT